MLTSSYSLLSSLTPAKPHHFDLIHRLPISNHRILLLGFESKRVFGERAGRIRVSDQKKMTELVKNDAFRRGDGSENEADAILRNGYSVFGLELDLRRFESTLNRMSKWLVAVLFGLVILWKHDPEALWAALGSVVNSWVSITLKNILNHERPASALRSDPGMPSSHAQSLFYTAFFVVLSLFQWQGMNAITLVTGSIILICGSYLTWLRVSQKLHTINQVVVGAVLGSACSITWFWTWHSFVQIAFVASIWVRIAVVLVSLACFVNFFIYVVQHWLSDDE